MDLDTLEKYANYYLYVVFFIGAICIILCGFILSVHEWPNFIYLGDGIVLVMVGSILLMIGIGASKEKKEKPLD